MCVMTTLVNAIYTITNHYIAITPIRSGLASMSGNKKTLLVLARLGIKHISKDEIKPRC
ncbi:protein of unknown function [Moritella yayanosii]|uniref:Uncharacterized protein n=1 Tax=Moritella yayanosii TaxID=69539 RepID=A0A330LXX3_9GAMM|nr:protein of unknown function [Moritella yayanosii]